MIIYTKTLNNSSLYNKLYDFVSDFGNRRIGMNCCMRTLNCFDNLPTYLDESVFHKGNHQFTESERTHLC